MSTLKVNTVQHNTSGFNNVVQFTDGAGTQNGTLCRAWVNFNGQGTVAIRADFNVNTITDNGTGEYTVNFSNAMSDANYTVSGSVVGSTITQTYSWIGGPASGANALHSTTAVRFGTIHYSGAQYDQDVVQIIIHR
jgi:hypothetical protein